MAQTILLLGFPLFIDNFRLEHDEYLWALLLLPIVYFASNYFLNKRKNIFEKWGNDNVIKSLTKGIDHSKDKLRNLLLLLSVLFATIALINPQWGFNNEHLKTNASDIYVALDVSKSMDVQDVTPSRLIRSKKYAIDLIEALKGNNIGLIVFAGSAYMQMPLTSDYAAAIMMVNAANTDVAGTQGTNINAVADLVKRASEKQGSSGSKLIIITDGEDHEGASIDAIESLKKQNVITYCIGAGTPNGGYIPNGQSYKLDENNKPIVSKINVDLINDIAKSGGGRAYGVEDEKSIETIYNDIANEGKSEKTTKVFNQYKSYFQIFLFLALCLLIAEYILSKWYHLENKKNEK